MAPAVPRCTERSFLEPGNDPVSDAVEPLEPAEAEARGDAHGVPGVLAGLNVFRLLLRRPRLAKGVADLLLALLGSDALEARRRELVIMRVAWVTGSDYEWSQHWRIATGSGVPPEDLLAVRDWRSAAFDDVDRAVLGAVDDALAGRTPSPQDLARLRAALGDDATIDLVAAIGAWSMVSLLLRAFEVGLEPDFSSWPPDGASPPPHREGAPGSGTD